MLEESLLKEIHDRGSDPKEVENQLKRFETGFPHLPLVKPAVPGDGILRLSEAEQKELVQLYESSKEEFTILKFVPASGAASRMFKALFAFVDNYDGSDEAYEKMKADQGPQSVYYFFKHLEKFAFYPKLKRKFAELHDLTLEEALLKRQYVDVLKTLLDPEGLNYGQLPKGLLDFHTTEGEAKTPVQEQLVEAANYAASQGSAHLHFTVSPEHQAAFESHVAQVKDAVEKKYGVSIAVSYSQQKPSTDTIAVDMDNEPFQEEDGSTLFRPAGHGALLANLNELQADIIFVKNIDNVLPDSRKESTFWNKKLLGGLMIKELRELRERQHQVESIMQREFISELEDYLETKMNIFPPAEFDRWSVDEKKTYLRKKLHRPLRICGMVKAEGNTGGGPFWAKNPDGSTSLQVVETAQIDLNDAEQKGIFDGSTHFNPVDVVFNKKDNTGEDFDLMNHRDMDTGFISQKSKSGKDLKALELPGLWNGSMSDWNTIFVEVPLDTFSPVKTVNDLLKDEHQA